MMRNIQNVMHKGLNIILILLLALPSIWPVNVRAAQPEVGSKIEVVNEIGLDSTLTARPALIEPGRVKTLPVGEDAKEVIDPLRPLSQQPCHQVFLPIILGQSTAASALQAVHNQLQAQSGCAPVGNTIVTGQMLDANDAASGTITPLNGATVIHIESGLSTTTTDNGTFTLALPDTITGTQHFDYDGNTATPTGTYGAYRGSIDIIAGVTHVIERPIYIMRIDKTGEVMIDPDVTIVLNNSNINVSLTIPAHTVKDEAGNDYTGSLSISEVPAGFTPASLPDTLEPGFVITVQPMGLTFNQPVPVTFQNDVDNLTAQSEVDLWSLDHATGEFFIAGTGKVSADGSQIETISGGIREASWHFPAPPPPLPPQESGEGEAQDQDKECKDPLDRCFGSSINLHNGTLKTNIALPSYVSLGETRSLQFIYNSERAYPQNFIPFHSTIQQRGTVPPSLSYQVILDGVAQGETFVDTSNLTENSDETIRGSAALTTSVLTTGVYNYSLWMTNNYVSSSFSSLSLGTTMVVNEQGSAFGAGWGLAGLQRLYPQNDQSVLVAEGAGPVRHFRFGNDGGLFPSAFPVGNGPRSLVAADFNKDNNLDLAVVNDLDGNVSILLGDSNGGFSAPTNFSVGDGPFALVSGDFNEDNNLDLAVVNQNDNNVSILLGDGNGAFSGPTNFSVGNYPFALVSGDFNEDNNLDLAVSNFDDDNVAILLGDGNGAFSAPTNFSAGNSPNPIVSGDFNEDNNLDLAVANFFGGNVSILLGDGNGSFSAPTTFSVGNGSRGIVSGDFNEDNNLDLAVANQNDNNVSILLGDGNGGFSAPTNFSVGNHPTALASGDFNEDNNLDLAVSNFSHDDNVSILLGDGNGGFSAPTNFSVGNDPFALVSGDFNEDNNLDLAVANVSDDNVSILLGGGNGAFSAPTNFSVGNGPRGIVSGDFNEDDNLDLAVANADGDNVSILLGNGNGGFSASTNFSVGNDPQDIISGDFNEDNNLDLAVANRLGGNVSILLGDGNGGFSAPTNFSVGNGPRGIVSGDFNEDNNLDLAVANWFGGNVSVLLGDGNGGFSAPTNFSVGNDPQDIISGDFNEDNNLDLAVANADNDNVSVLLGDGNGGFSAQTNFSVGNGPHALVSRDFNEDNNLDLAVSNFDDDNVSILLGDGNGGFSAQTNFSVGNGPKGIVSGDFNEDDHLDLAVANATDGNVSILLGDGNGGFSAQTNFPASNVPQDLISGDFNEDDHLDLAVVKGVNKVSILLQNSRSLQTPDGDFTTLIFDDPGYTRTYKNGTRILFDNNGLQTALIDRNGNTTHYTYDAQKRLTKITDPAGLETNFVYSGNYLSTVTTPDGRVSAFQHNGSGDLTQVDLPDSTSQSFGYDARHLMTSEFDRKGQLTTHLFNDQGRIVSATRPDGTVRSTTNSQQVGWVNPASGFGTQANPAAVTRPNEAASSMTDGEGRKTQYIMGPLGREIGITNTVGLFTQIDRNADGDVTQTTLPNGAVFDRTLDGDGNVRQVVDKTLNGSTQFTYDPIFNQITSITDPQNKTATLNYDQFGNPVQVSTPLNRTTLSSYDSRGLPTIITDTLGTPTTLTYNAQGNPVQTTQGTGNDARTTNVTYTNEGYISTLTDPESRQFSFTYDALGRVKTTTAPDSRITGFGYDANGNLTRITPPGRPSHIFVINNVDLVTAYIAPDVGEVSHQTDLTYNDAQELLRVDRPDGKFIEYGYDYAGRLGSITTTQGVYLYDYDVSTGNLNSMTTPGGGQVRYDYNNYLINKTTWTGMVAGTVERTYDANGRVDSLGVNGSDVVSFQFNEDGQLTQAGVLNISYDTQTGLLTGTDAGMASDALGYNSFGEALNYTMQYNGGDVYAEVYSYDDLGRISTKTETINSVATTYGYTYDLAGRLSQVRQNGALIADYSYDVNGNRLAETIAGLNGTYDDQDRLLTYGPNTYNYTANGELTRKVNGGQTTAYQYDEFSNLISVTLPDTTLIEYIIDANDRRIGRKVNGTLGQGFLYQDDLNPIAELDGAGTVVSRFVYATQANVPDYLVKGGNTYRIVTDQLGSVRLVINIGTGQVAQRLDYDAFGNVLNDTNPGFQPFGFAGGLYDAATGLVRFGARDYDAEVGRWTTKDPIGFAGGDTNLYAYVGGDPVNFVDITGTDSSYGRISIKGDPRFTTETLSALGLLDAKAPDDYRKVETYIGIIEQSTRSGMAAYENPPIFRVSDQIASSSPTYYASSIAHDAMHSEQYHTYPTINGMVPDHVWTSKTAEQACNRYQLQVLKKIGGTPEEIKHLLGQDGSHSDIDGDGDYDWDDYYGRNW